MTAVLALGLPEPLDQDGPIVAALPPSLDATDVGPLLDRLTEATDDRPLLVVHLAAQQAQAARVVHLLRSPLELQAVATISSELSPLGAATVAALCAEPTHTFQIPAGSVTAVAADVRRRAGVHPNPTSDELERDVQLEF